jgi:outer membrane protein assembly factor BamB
MDMTTYPGGIVMYRLGRRFFLLTAVLILLTPGISIGQLSTDAPWPKFHYDNRNTGKTSNFGTQVGKLKWKVSTAGPVTSSPAIDKNGIVYVGSADNNIYAINGETGVIEWKYQTGGAINFSSPAIDNNGTVYIGSFNGYLYAFDTNTINPDDGSTWLPKWKFQTRGAIASSPAIGPDGTVIFGCADGNLYAVNPDGNLKWKTPVGVIERGVPAIDSDLGQVYIGTTVPDVFYTLDLQTGALIWAYDLLCGGAYASPAIASDSSIIFTNFTTYYSDETCLDAFKFQIYNFSSIGGLIGGLTQTAPNWKLDINNDIYTTPAILEDNSFFVGAGASLNRILSDGTIYFSQTIDGQRIESSPIIDGAKFIYVGTNGGTFYCLNADRPEPGTTVVWQYPPAGEPRIASSILSSPAIGNDERHSVYMGASDNNVYAFYDGIRIKGKVSLVEGSGESIQKKPLSAVKMTLRSELLQLEKETQTDANGYEFTGLANGTYTITPELPGYIFSPETLVVTVNDQDVNNANFEAFRGFSLSGTITDKNGTGLPGVLVTLDGLKSQPATAFTDSTGFYQFTGLGFDTYTVTPFIEGYGFTPPFQNVTISPSDTEKYKININFVATLGYQISGKITGVDTQALQGVTVTLTGGPQNISWSTETDINGAFSFLELANGTYLVTPSFNDYEFNPPAKTVTIAAGSVLNVDFTAATGANISGYVLAGNSPLRGVTVTLLNSQTPPAIMQTVQTDDFGFYALIGIPDGIYTVEPVLAGYGFNPASKILTVINADIKNVNFRAVPGLSLSGKVINILSIPVAGVTLELTGSTSTSSTTTNTDSSGNYSFLGLEIDTYTVAVNTPGYQAFPASQTFDIVSEGENNVNFTVFPICPTVYINIPFGGESGTLVNIFGVNFGLSAPPADTLFDVNGTTLEGGVYFGALGSDPSKWVKAAVEYWSPFKILARAPSTSGIAQVWVITNSSAIENPSEQNSQGCLYTSQPLTNFFIYGF